MPRPKKKPGTVMNTDLRIPLTPAQKETIAQALEVLGSEMAAWARPILLREAESVLAQKKKGKGRS